METLLALRTLVENLVVPAAVLCALHVLSIWLRRPRINISGKHVLITGGSQGLGKALAAICVDRGARVTIVARTASKLHEACQEIKLAGDGNERFIQHFALDFSTATCEQITTMMQEAARSFGRIDVFVSNAGTGGASLVVGPPLGEVESLLEQQVSVNLLGSLRCVVAAARLMASDGQGGHISVVSSFAGLASCPGYAIYSATKFGQRGFLGGAYDELRQHGVHLSVFYPGSIKTPGFEMEQEGIPLVTQKIESQCSDVASAEACAGALVRGIECGAREITNELLQALLIDQPTGGCAPLDAAIGALVQVIRAVTFLYFRVMCHWYIERPGPRCSSEKDTLKKEY